MEANRLLLDSATAFLGRAAEAEQPQVVLVVPPTLSLEHTLPTIHPQLHCLGTPLKHTALYELRGLDADKRSCLFLKQ